jgi:Mrp family chromosome partitioning ATPase/capsular polysaccharide biosynthesis protein
MQNDNGAHTVRMGDYFVLLRRQWLVLLLCLALGIGAAVAYLQWAPKEYRSVASVLVTDSEPTSGDRNSTINLDTEAQLVTATETVAAAAEELGEPGDAREVADHVGVSVPPNTEILDIAFTDDTAAGAQRGALAFADAYLAQRRATAEAVLESETEALQQRIDAVQEQLDEVLATVDGLPDDSAAQDRALDQAASLNNQLASLGSQQNLVQSETVSPGRIVTQPRVPANPSSPDPLITLAAGLVLGLALGVGLAALRHRADDVIRTPEDLFARTRVPVAAVLSTRLHGGEVSVLPPLSADGRGYARLRNLVTTSLTESDRKVVLVAGVRRGGGPVAANLAASLARAGEDVFLVCADVFGPTAASLFDGPASAGLAEVLAGEARVDDVVRVLPGIPTLRVLGPGLDPDRADALLQTRSPRKLIDELSRSASYVVLEAPPTTDSPDAQTLANVAEIAVLVVEAGQSSAREVIDACAQLESMHTAVLGGVVARYGRDSDPDQRPRPGSAAEDTAERAGPEPAPVEAEPVPAASGRPVAADDDVPADDVADEDAPDDEAGDDQAGDDQAARAEARRTPNGTTSGTGGPDTTVVPVGGRPQLVPPGPVKPAPR